MSSSDAWSWGQRTEADVDIMNSQMENCRLGHKLPPDDGSGGVEDDHPNIECYGTASGYMGNKNLERFNAHNDDGTSVKPMYEDQATYQGYGEVKDGYERNKYPKDVF